MDNRYLVIIVIIAICFVNLFIISSNSDVIGSATVIDGNYIFALPKNFNPIDSEENSATIQNPNTNLNVKVYTNQNSKYNINKTMQNLNNMSNIKIRSNGTVNVDDIAVDAVYFTHTDDSTNRSIFIFTKDKSTFEINMKNFNYENDFNETTEVLGIIVNSIKINYKK